MAPFIGPTRPELLEMLRAWRQPRLPITLGRYEPQAMVEVVDGVWRIRLLVKDNAAVDRLGKERLARGDNFMPEHTWIFTPDGPIVAHAPSRRELAKLVETMRWDFGAEE